MKQSNRITYRFDQSGRTQTSRSELQQPSSKNKVSDSASDKVVPLHRNDDSMIMQELNPWHSPFQDDISALEELIRDTDSTSSKQGKQHRSEEYTHSRIKENQPAELSSLFSEPAVEDELPDLIDADYSLPELDQNELLIEEDVESERSFQQVYRRKSKSPSWLNVGLTVAGALATGALFGYILLALFTGSTFKNNDVANIDSVPASGSDIVTVPSGENTNAALGEDQSSLPAAGADTTINLTGLEQTYYFVQYGVFSNTEGRDAALAQLSSKGAAAASMKTEQGYRVYAGVAGDRNRAKLITNQLTDLELYIKEITVPAPQSLPFSGDEKEAQQFFEQTAELVETLDNLALAQLEQSTLSSLSTAAAEAWQLKYERWGETADHLLQAMSKDDTGYERLESIMASIDGAAKALTEYNNRPSLDSLWSSQTALMEAILIQKEWFETISAL